MLGDSDLGSVIVSRPPEMSNFTDADWDHLTALWRSGMYEREFTAGFVNGQAFLAAPDGPRRDPLESRALRPAARGEGLPGLGTR
jgi:hypothetical protein